MASTVVVRGLNRISMNTETGLQSTTRVIASMSIDDSTVVFAQSHTALNTGGGGAFNSTDQAFDATPTTSTDSTSATVTHVTTYGTNIFTGFTIRRIALHDDVATNASSSSTTLVAGVDSQSLLKTSEFSIAITLRLKYIVC